MSKNVEFEFFKHPDKFAFLVEEPMPCSVCGSVELCFDAGSYVGLTDIECICASCLKAGKLIKLNIEANQFSGKSAEAAKIICFQTPSLPTWQEPVWPNVNGKPPVFECIASQADFKSKQEFMDSKLDAGLSLEEIERLWNLLPNQKLNHYSKAGDISVYLFTLDGKKYWTWDSN